MARVYNETSIRDKVVARRKPVDSGISTTAFPANFKNKFIARLRDTNIDPNKESFGVFGQEESQKFLNEKLPTFDNNPYFLDEQSNLRANDFLNKYRNSFIQPDEEKVSAESTRGFILGDPRSNLAGTFPGGMEVS